MSDLLLRPPAIINAVIRLHGSDHAIVGETLDQRRIEMLGVLDAETSLTLVGDRLVDLQHFSIRAVADRVNCDLQVVRVRIGDIRLHPAIGH